jgi:fused signal recognition particle receptor
LVQAKEFAKSTNLTGLIVTKLDGTAKGGVIIQISAEQKIPIKYIGVGEGIDDLQNFDSEKYIEALFS